MKKLCEKNKKLVLAASAVSLGMLAGGVALMNHGYIASAESAFPGDGTIQVLDGTSLKLNAGGGLRFIVKMNAAAKNYIKDDDANDEVKLVVRVGAVKYFGEKWLNCEVDEEKLYRVDGDEAWYAKRVPYQRAGTEPQAGLYRAGVYLQRQDGSEGFRLQRKRAREFLRRGYGGFAGYQTRIHATDFKP